MALRINKRQQARNEQTLQDLIKNVPGNDRCADCFARNPGWWYHNSTTEFAANNALNTGWASWNVRFPVTA